MLPELGHFSLVIALAVALLLAMGATAYVLVRGVMAMASGKDVVLVDTAGRLPTQLHLMEELKKIKRPIAKAGNDEPRSPAGPPQGGAVNEPEAAKRLNRSHPFPRERGRGIGPHLSLSAWPSPARRTCRRKARLRPPAGGT